jgi:hypothetical protein
MKYLVTVGYDPAGVYYSYESNVPGLAASAFRLEALVEIVRAAVPNLTHDSTPKVIIQPALAICALPRRQYRGR